MGLGFWSACGAQVIRFSYATIMSHPQGSGYMQAKHKSRSTHKNYQLIPQLAANNTYVWFNAELLDTQDNYVDTTVYIQQ